jgi:hypothetical protein
MNSSIDFEKFRKVTEVLNNLLEDLSRDPVAQLRHSEIIQSTTNTIWHLCRGLIPIVHGEREPTSDNSDFQSMLGDSVDQKIISQPMELQRKPNERVEAWVENLPPDQATPSAQVKTPGNPRKVNARSKSKAKAKAKGTLKLCDAHKIRKTRNSMSTRQGVLTRSMGKAVMTMALERTLKER